MLDDYLTSNLNEKYQELKIIKKQHKKVGNYILNNLFIIYNLINGQIDL